MMSNKFFNQLRHALCLVACAGLLGASTVWAQNNDATPITRPVKKDPAQSDSMTKFGFPVRSVAPVKHGQTINPGQFAANQNSDTDFNGDQMNDLVYFDAATSQWNVHDIAGATTTTIDFGAAGGTPVAADYDGDGVMDIAMVRADEDGNMCWELLQSTAGAASIDWGLATDVPVKGDYDGDGLADLAVWRAGTGQWLILASSTGSLIELQMVPASSDRPVPGDYDGDAVTDAAVFRMSDATFYFTGSVDLSLHAQAWVPVSRIDEPSLVPSDYDGDGITDFAIFTPHDGAWRILLSSTGGFLVHQMPGNSRVCDLTVFDPCLVKDFAQTADYDNDGIADPAIWTPESGSVYAIGSQTGPTRFATETGDGVSAVSAYFVSE